jgi:hypothetical protein
VHQGCRDVVGERHRHEALGALVVDEEESPVLAVVDLREVDRSAEGSAELVLAVFLAPGSVGIRDEIVGVEGFVAQILPGVAPETIGSGFDDGVDDCADGVPEFRAVVAVLELEFFDGIGRGRDGVAAEDLQVIVDAADAVVDLSGLGAVDEETGGVGFRR